MWGFFRLEYEQLETLGAPDFSSVPLLEQSQAVKSFDKVRTISIVLAYFIFDFVLEAIWGGEGRGVWQDFVDLI